MNQDGKMLDTSHDECVQTNVKPETHSTSVINNSLNNAHLSLLPNNPYDFLREHALDQYTELFGRAIHLARSPVGLESIPELQEEEQQALREEVDHKWRLPRAMWVTAIVCSVGAAVQGWDQTGSNGANLSFPEQLGIGSNSARDKLLVGLINAVPQASTVVIGCWCSEPLNIRVGRRGTIFVSGIFCFLSVIGSALTQRWYQLLVCRILLGIGEGIKSSTTVVLAAESAPASIRGALVMGWQLWVACGIFLGTAANLAVVNCGSITWRLQLGSACIPAIPLLLFIYSCPESPRWYMKKGRAADAFASLSKLRNHSILAARDLLLLHAQLEQERSIVRRSGNAIARFYQLFTVPRVRRATLAASVVMAAQQLCGINIIAFYSATVFVTVGHVSEESALWASFGYGILGFISAIPALKTIDSFGRRSLLLATFPHMAWSLLAIGLCFLIPGEGHNRLAGIVTCLFLFTIFYSLGDGPVTYVYAAEVLPLSHRELGMAWAVCVNAVGSFTLSFTFPYMLVALTPTGAFGFYCGTNVLAFVLIFLFVPETRQYTLEELDHVFSIPTNVYVRHQLTRTLPAWIKRWIFWQRNVEFEPLTLPNSLGGLDGDKNATA